MIRKATTDDIEAIVDLLVKTHAAHDSNGSMFPVDLATGTAFIADTIRTGIVFVSENSGTITASIGAFIEEPFFWTRYQAVIVSWWASDSQARDGRNALQLINKVVAEAESRNLKLFAGNICGYRNEALEKYFTRKGFAKIGSTFIGG